MQPEAGAGGPGGLSDAEARERLGRYGPNRITKPWEITLPGIAKEEITEPMILLLLAVGFFYTLLADLGEAITLYAIIAALVIVEIWNEYRAKKAISSLAALAEPKTKVLRERRITEVSTEEVVPGDLLVLVPGTRIAADGRLLAGVSLQVDESSLTGESFPLERVMGEELFAGTLAISMEGLMEAAVTGGGTRIGRISEGKEGGEGLPGLRRFLRGHPRGEDGKDLVEGCLHGISSGCCSPSVPFHPLHPPGSGGASVPACKKTAGHVPCHGVPGRGNPGFISPHGYFSGDIRRVVRWSSLAGS